MGACLDRNGLRPARYWRTKDDLIYVASEVCIGIFRSNSQYAINMRVFGYEMATSNTRYVLLCRLVCLTSPPLMLP